VPVKGVLAARDEWDTTLRRAPNEVRVMAIRPRPFLITARTLGSAQCKTGLYFRQ
jgi:hypothetical protein